MYKLYKRANSLWRFWSVQQVKRQLEGTYMRRKRYYATVCNKKLRRRKNRRYKDKETGREGVEGMKRLLIRQSLIEEDLTTSHHQLLYDLHNKRGYITQKCGFNQLKHHFFNLGIPTNMHHTFGVSDCMHGTCNSISFHWIA